jgi:hypothetical protein
VFAVQHSLFVPCVATAVCLLATIVARAAEPAAKPASGEGAGTIEVVGKGIERLVLAGPGPGQEQCIDRPGPSIRLPAGCYLVKEVGLKGGLARHHPGPQASVAAVHRFTVVPGQPYRLEIDTRLASTVTCQRRGSVLKLDYALVGADGCKYSSRDRSDPPRFIVLRGGREIGSGSFKYG